MVSFHYKPDGEVIKQFMKDTHFFRGIRGPVGSGKSVACCIEIFRRALIQEKNKEGKRKSRWAVIRNTNPQLRTTTIKTWLDWFDENSWGPFNWSVPYTHKLNKGEIELEVIFLALDRPEDVKKLLSLELTGVWINEARELPKAIIDACSMRVGRFPSMKDGGPSWFGVIADSNAPEEDHWWSVMSGEANVPDYITQEDRLMLIKPDNWRFFIQPSGMKEEKNNENNIIGYSHNPKAENTKNLNPEYYNQIIRGKSKGWIDVYIMNRLGAIEEGKPVFHSFNEEVHLTKEKILFTPKAPVYIGLDFGLTPSAVFAQRVGMGVWNILKELVCQDMGAVKFAELLRQEMSEYKHTQFDIYGDPSGDFRSQTDESTPFQILRGAGIQAHPAPSNDISLRLESVNSVLTRMIDGHASFFVSPNCVNIKKGFLGGYYYRRLQVSGDRYEDKPMKNRYSHVMDALQYLLLGAGEGKSLIQGRRPMKPFVVERNYDVFNRKTRVKKKNLWQRMRSGL
jgi:hypothetical protein